MRAGTSHRPWAAMAAVPISRTLVVSEYAPPTERTLPGAVPESSATGGAVGLASPVREATWLTRQLHGGRPERLQDIESPGQRLDELAAPPRFLLRAHGGGPIGLPAMTSGPPTSDLSAAEPAGQADPARRDTRRRSVPGAGRAVLHHVPRRPRCHRSSRWRARGATTPGPGPHRTRTAYRLILCPSTATSGRSFSTSATPPTRRWCASCSGGPTSRSRISSREHWQNTGSTTRARGPSTQR